MKIYDVVTNEHVENMKMYQKCTKKEDLFYEKAKAN